MIAIQAIKTSNQTLYQYMEQLITQAFPSDEYRDLTELRHYTDHQPKFINNIILENGEAIGLITYWNFNAFAYIEHFAIESKRRNGGKGRSIIQQVCQELKIPVVLEVEEPLNEMAQRRIGFYQRQGFKLWSTPYQQPPYKKGDNWLPMKIMAYGNIDETTEFENIKRALYQEVYHAL